MIEKVVKKWKLGDPAADKADLDYWLSRTPEERIQAVDELRAEWYGSPRRSWELVSAFNTNGVHYLVAGAYARGLYGSPRCTHDLDLLVEASPANAERIVESLRDFQIDSAPPPLRG